MNSQAFQIAKGIGTNIAEGNRERNDASAMGSILRNAMNSQDPQALNSAMADIMSGISEKGRPAAIKALEGVVDRMDNTRTAQDKEKSQRNELKKLGIDPGILDLPPTLQKSAYEKAVKENELKEKKQSTQDAFNRMSELVENVGMTSGFTRKFGGKTDSDVAEFESLNGMLESYMTDLVSKGKLTDTRFKYIINTLLPRPGQRVSTIKGNMKAIAKMIGLDTDTQKIKDKKSPTEDEINSSMKTLPLNVEINSTANIPGTDINLKFDGEKWNRI